MLFGRKTSTIASNLLFLLCCYILSTGVSAQAQENQSATVKYVFEINYPQGNKQGYLQWVKSIVEVLQSPSEVKRITSYDNYYSSKPHRLVEFEFADMIDAARYWERKEIRKVSEELIYYGGASAVKVFIMKSDYTKNDYRN